MMASGIWPALALAALVLPGCAEPLGFEAPTPTGQIDGAVVGPLLDPFGKLPVRLEPLGWTDTTSERGGFTFRDVPVGNYTLFAQAKDTKAAVANITVYKDDITRIVLQLFPVDPPPGTMIPAEFEGSAALALPGELCEGCAWSLHLSQQPEEVIFKADWESVRTGEMVIEITDSNYRVLGHMEGVSPLYCTIQADEIPVGEDALHIQARFGQDFVPQTDFRLNMQVELYIGANRALWLGQQ